MPGTPRSRTRSITVEASTGGFIYILDPKPNRLAFAITVPSGGPNLDTLGTVNNPADTANVATILNGAALNLDLSRGAQAGLLGRSSGAAITISVWEWFE